MDEAAKSPRTLRFGAYELDLRAGELRKSGLRIRLQEQPFRVLATLVERPGEDQVYVETFPGHLGKWQISTSGGTDPMWRRDGKELFYLTPSDGVMAVEVRGDPPPFRANNPKPLFQAQTIESYWWRSGCVVSPDGQRFLVLVPAGESKPSPVTVVVNWPAPLKNPGK